MLRKLACLGQENRGSNVHVDQGRESCIARQLQSVVEKYGTDRSALGPVDDYGTDGRLNVAEEYSKNSRSSDVEQGRESCVARQSQSDEEHSMNSRSLDVDGRLTSDGRGVKCVDGIEMHDLGESEVNSSNCFYSGIENELRRPISSRAEMRSLMFDNRAVDECRGSLENRKGNLTYDDLNVKQGRVLSDTRHSQDGTVTKVLAVVKM